MFNKKVIKVSIFEPGTPPSVVKTSNGDEILDNICIESKTDEMLFTGEYYNDSIFLIDEGGIHKHIQEEAILKVRMDYGEEYFRIASIRKNSRDIVVFSRQITISETVDMWLEDVRPESQGGQGALSWIRDNSKGKKDIQVFSDITVLNTAYYMDMSMYKALHDCDQSFKNRWGGEIKRRGYNLTINKRIGTHRGVQIRSGKNLTGFEASTNIDNIVTRIKPKGFDGITISGYIDSPLISKYTSIKTRVIKYDDVKVKDHEREDDEGYDTLEEAQAELIRRAELEFSKNHIDELRGDYRVNFVQLEYTEEYKNYVQAERVYLGDEIDVYEEKLDISLTVRAVRKKYDVLRQRVIEIELSNAIEKKKAPTKGDILDKLEQVESNMNDSNKWMEDAINNATDQITNGIKDSYVVQRKNEILIMDTKDINTAMNVWRWNSGGLAHSSTGYFGTYSTAITQDGSIVATMMTSGTLNANLVNVINLTAKSMNIDSVVEAINNGKTSIEGSKVVINNQTLEAVFAKVNGVLGEELLKNPNFDNGLNFWNKITTHFGNIEVVKNTSTNSNWLVMEHIPEDGSYSNFGIYQEFDVKSYKNCTLSIKYTGKDTIYNKFSIRIMYLKDNSWYGIRTQDITCNTFNNFENPENTDIDINIPDGTTKLKIEVKNSFQDRHISLYIDYVSIKTKSDIFVNKSEFKQTSDEVSINAEKIKAVKGEVKKVDAELKVQAGEIKLKTSAGDVRSIMELNPNSLMVGFNKINDTFAVTPREVYMKDQNGNKHLRLYDGKIRIVHPNGSDFGFLGRNQWDGTNVYGMSIAMDAQTSFSVGFRSGNNYISSLTSVKNPFTSNGVYMDEGIHVFKKFITHNSEFIGTQRISDINHPNGSGKGDINIWSNIDLHNWNIRNAQISRSLSPKTTTLKRLIEENKVNTNIYMSESGDKDTITILGKEIESTYKVDTSVSYECVVEIPQIYAENIKSDYKVVISKYGFGDYYISERTPYYFKVISDRELSFDWHIIATKIDFENNNITRASEPYTREEPETLENKIEPNTHNQLDFLRNEILLKYEFWKLYSKVGD